MLSSPGAYISFTYDFICFDPFSNLTHSSADRPIFALLIGIDECQRDTKPSPSQLGGCVVDSDNIFRFLTASFNVLPRHISRTSMRLTKPYLALVKITNHLIDNPTIKEYDFSFISLATVAVE